MFRRLVPSDHLVLGPNFLGKQLPSNSIAHLLPMASGEACKSTPDFVNTPTPLNCFRRSSLAGWTPSRFHGFCILVFNGDPLILQAWLPSYQKALRPLKLGSLYSLFGGFKHHRFGPSF